VFGLAGASISAPAGWISLDKGRRGTCVCAAGRGRGACLKRRSVPDDIARTVLFLASAELGACKSRHIVVDGGWV